MSDPVNDPLFASKLDVRFVECRGAAMDVLRPSDAELARGLALHRESVVVDGYGFSAFAAADDHAIREVTERGESASMVAALDVQSRMTRMADDPWQRERFVEAWRVAGVTCVIRNSGEESDSVERLLPRLAHNTYVTDALADQMQRITTADDITAAKHDGRFGFCFTTNGVPIAGHFQTTEEALWPIGVFRQLGVRMMHLTYNRRNRLGDGCAEDSNAGLSDLGRHAIERMNQLGVIVDVAHSGQRTSLEAAQHSTRPMVASHTACSALHDHCRGKSDEVLRAIAATGGVIGICCIPGFLGRAGDVSALLDHIDHAVSVVGVEHVAIGTDVSVSLPRNPDDPAVDPLPRTASAQRFESFWPPGSIGQERWNQPEMHAALAWTNWPLFTVGLVQRGYSDDHIRQIIGGNLLRVLKAV